MEAIKFNKAYRALRGVHLTVSLWGIVALMLIAYSVLFIVPILQQVSLLIAAGVIGYAFWYAINVRPTAAARLITLAHNTQQLDLTPTMADALLNGGTVEVAGAAYRINPVDAGYDLTRV